MSDYSVHLNFQRFLTTARGFAGDTRGNFATMTAILLLPMFGFSALAIDHWSVASAKSEIENAADAAALGAISRAAAVLKATGDKATAIKEGQFAGEDQFLGNIGKIPNTTTGKPTITVAIKGLEITSSIKWNGVVKTHLGSLFKWSSQDLSGIAASSLTMQAYVQIHLLVDNSGSMGIGATSADQKKLFDETSCAIACHLPNRDGYLKAQKNKIKTRIDIVREALSEASENLSINATTPNILKIAFSSFSNDVVEIINIRSEAARSEKAFKEAIGTKIGARGGLELTREGGGTDFHGALTTLTQKLGNSNGTGSSESDPLIYVVFITDGVEHSQQFTGSSWAVDKDLMGVYVNPVPDINKQTGQTTYRYGGQTQRDAGWVQTIDPKLCKGIKDKQIPLLTLEIEYLIPEEKYWLHDGKRDIRFGWIQDNLQVRNRNTKLTFANEKFNACATPGNAFQASTAGDIQASIKKIFEQIAPKPPRLLK